MLITPQFSGTQRRRTQAIPGFPFRKCGSDRGGQDLISPGWRLGSQAEDMLNSDELKNKHVLVVMCSSI